jgi:hypothetical protein
MEGGEGGKDGTGDGEVDGEALTVLEETWSPFS